MIIDLTHPVFSGMPVYPGDTETVITPHMFHDREGFSVHALKLGSHAGTHLDAPYHYFPDAPRVDSLTVLEACIGPARVLDGSKIINGTEIMPGDLDIPPGGFLRGERILIATGWSDHIGNDDFYKRYPSISRELAILFAECGIALLGVESPSLHSVMGDEIHKLLLRAGIIVVESLANLCQLSGKTVFFSAAPLKLSGLDGSPVRAYAII